MKPRKFTANSYLIAFATVATGVALSVNLDDWSWFSRSGSLVVVNGIILTSHQIIEHIQNLGRYQRQQGSQFNKDWATEEKHTLIHDDHEYRWRSEKNGLTMLIGGTLIWGIGDVINLIV
jgi:hypothetical protein